MPDPLSLAPPPVVPAAQLYPFYGLDGFPQNYPLLVSGDAQSASSRGTRVTVLANATELFGTMDQSMPSFEEWLRDAMGINATATLEVRGRSPTSQAAARGTSAPRSPLSSAVPRPPAAPPNPRPVAHPRPPAAHSVQDFDDKIWLPMPVNQTVGYDTSVSCTKKYGYNYYLQIQFVILVFVVFCQVCRWGGSPHTHTHRTAGGRALPPVCYSSGARAADGRTGWRPWLCVSRCNWTCGDCAGRWVHRVHHEPLVAQGFQQ